MNGLTITAYGTSGKPIPLDEPAELEIRAGLDSPAVNFSAEFPCGEAPPEIRSIAVYREREPLLDGPVDRQSFGRSGRGTLLRLEARGKGALLLDNEAQPRTLWAANLSTAFARTAGLYGFALYNPNPSRILTVYTVYKGMSEWDAFCGFVRRMHNLTPYVEGGQIMVCKPKETTPIMLSNQGGGIPYLSVEHIRSPYNVISQVHIRDEDGQYSSLVKNRNVAADGIQRRRFLIPGTEYADNPGLDASQRIRASMYGYEQAVVRCPELRRIFLGQPVRMLDDSLLSSRLMIHAWRYLAGSSGIFTELDLRNGDFY